MRDKENSDDYRYFPDPDIIPFHVSQEKIDEIKKSLPELPFVKLKRYIGELGIPEATARQMFRYIRVTEFFEEALKEGAGVKNAFNLITGTIYSKMSTEEDKENFSLLICAGQFASLVKLLDEKKINFKMAQTTLQEMLDSGKSADEFIGAKDLEDVPADELTAVCKEAIEANPKAVADIKAGKDKAINVLFGYIMKQTKGKADAIKAQSIIMSLIENMF
jgi:aspartyl-tRNA(Asn)/glutamyl-tRNA(Gln) amidotransferase subunit B